MTAPHSHAPTPRLRAVENAEVTLIGERTRHRFVQAAAWKLELWPGKTPVCPVLARHILHLGIIEAYPPFHLVRRGAPITELLICFGGEGRILVDEEWVRFGAGAAAILSQRGYSGYHAEESSPWMLVRVRASPEKTDRR
jgi:hypothetical protein